MAKSIFEILDDLQTETSVPEVKDKDGKIIRKSMGNVEHTLPRSLFPKAEIFEDGEKLLDWAEEHGFTHALLQSGIQKGLIDCRARFKAIKKDTEWTPEIGQSAVNEMTWTVTERPKENNAAKIKEQAELAAGIKLASAMKLAGVADEKIMESLVPVYGEETAEMIISSIN
jgi:hypothetical protein